MAVQLLTKFYILSLLVVCFVTTAAPVKVTCSQHCRCYTDMNYRTSAKCDLNGLNSSSLADIHLPQDLTYLDLSSSGLKEIQVSFLNKLSNISYLNLANNSLEDMKNDSFSELKQLHTLDLSYSRLRSLGKGLSKLENLFVKQAYLASYIFGRELLSLPRIKFIAGITCGRCECNITRDARGNQTHPRFLSLDFCDNQSQAEPFCKHLKPGVTFTLQFHCPPFPLPYILYLIIPQRLFHCLYPLASVGLLLNLGVISLVSTSKYLRKSPTMFLLLIMAVCDLFMGLWSILTATFNVRDASYGFVLNYFLLPAYPTAFELMCPYMTFLFGVVQFTSVMTSFFLSIERYLVIVYSMNPGVRLTRRLAAICVCTTWCFAIAYNAYAVFFVSREMRQENLDDSVGLCTASGNRIALEHKGHSGSIPLSVFLGFFYILIFLCTIPLYIHMFIVVRKSSTQTGVKREGALARKLALLVLTNLWLSIIPLSLGPIFSNKKLEIYFRSIFGMKNNLVKNKAFVLGSVWVPVLLLCLNCCLNPFLFAFRHYLFKRHFRKTVQAILQKCRKEQSPPSGQQVKRQGGNNKAREEETAL